MHIEELICNVTVTFGTTALPLAAGPLAVDAPADVGPATSPEPSLPRQITGLEAEQIMASTMARQTAALAADGSLPAGVDPQKLADRVYRLMREELELGRERE